MKKIGYKTKAAAAAEAAAKMERKPARRNDARIIRRVIRRQESVTRKDIADWKRARLQATSTYEPKQVLLQRLFSEVIDDALMTSQVSVLRIGKSQGAEFELKMNGRKDEAETSVLFELIAERYAHKSLVVTTSTPLSQWGKVFAEPAMMHGPCRSRQLDHVMFDGTFSFV